MVRRSREEWWGLFEEHAGSGMTEKAFCEKRGLCPKHFNVRKKQLGWARKGASAFVRVEKGPLRDAYRMHSEEPRVLAPGTLRMGAARDE